MSALRVYAAGASGEVHMVAGYIERLRDADVVVTYDWTSDVKAAIEAGKVDASMTDVERMSYASHDFAAIAQADILWLLVPAGATIGAWAELGFACGTGTPVIASGPDVRRTIFTSLCRCFDSHEEAFRQLVERNAARLSEGV